MGERPSGTFKIQFLCTEIGRGHPFYLDGILKALDALEGPRPDVERSTVFKSSHGLSLAAWTTARWLYRKGSSGGAVGRLYAGLRNGSDYNHPGPGLRLLGRDVKRKYKSTPDPLVIAHPTLLGILRGRRNVIYQHGEVAVPKESVVLGAETVLVPTEEAARPFVEAGYAMNQVRVTGLCVEPGLSGVAEQCYHQRKQRLASEAPLTGLFVSSGAESRQHVTALVESVGSTMKAGGRAVVMARMSGRLHLELAECLVHCSQSNVYCQTVDEVAKAEADVVLVLYNSRRGELELTDALFRRADYLVAPAHERTNWALGLGLPMFPLAPSVGPFAPLNLKALTEAGVALALDGTNPPDTFGRLVSEKRADGSLLDMAKAGWGKHNINGFENIARFLTSEYCLSE